MSIHIAPLYVTYKEAAAVCRLSESMVRKLVRQGKLRVVRFGRAARIPTAELARIGTATQRSDRKSRNG
jgi:excisionase family DNA binding protein